MAFCVVLSDNQAVVEGFYIYLFSYYWQQRFYLK